MVNSTPPTLIFTNGPLVLRNDRGNDGGEFSVQLRGMELPTSIGARGGCGGAGIIKHSGDFIGVIGD